MARLTRARIIKNGAATMKVVPPPIAQATYTRIAREEMNAREAAVRILAEATRAAEGIMSEARSKARNVAETAAREAAELEQAKLAAQVLALRARESRAQETALDQSVELARVLAERLIGEALALDPHTIAKLAREALGEARGARSVHIEAHPDDVGALERNIALLAIAHVASIKSDATLERGSLRLHTDLGTIDAHLKPQLERLAAALRDALRSPDW